VNFEDTEKEGSQIIEGGRVTPSLVKVCSADATLLSLMFWSPSLLIPSHHMLHCFPPSLSFCGPLFNIKNLSQLQGPLSPALYGPSVSDEVSVHLIS
jgi:hypothetical protein